MTDVFTEHTDIYDRSRKKLIPCFDILVNPGQMTPVARCLVNPCQVGALLSDSGGIVSGKQEPQCSSRGQKLFSMTNFPLPLSSSKNLDQFNFR